jgi:hypothetical protein
MMKYMLTAMLVTALCCMGNTARADTIDSWHIYHRGKLLAQVVSPFYVLKLKAADIQPGDSLTIRYFCDTPCSDCPTKLFVKQGRCKIAGSAAGNGTGNPVSLPLNLLKAIHIPNHTLTLAVYYSEVFTKGGRGRTNQVCTIQLE